MQLDDGDPVLTSSRGIRTLTLHLEDGDEVLTVDDDRTRTPVRSPGEALESHLRMCQWLGTEKAHNMFRSLYKSAPPPSTGQTAEERAEIQHALFTATTDTAETIYVSPEMTRLTMALAEEYGEQNPVLHLPDVPMTSGLILLGGEGRSLPCFLHDDSAGPGIDEFARTRGFLFRLAGKGGVTWTIGDTEYVLEPEHGDDVDPAERSPMSRLKENGGIVVWDLYDAGEYLVQPGAWEDNGRPPFVISRTLAYTFDVEEPWHTVTSGPPVRRFLGALFQLMQQRVMYQEDWRPNRATARRFQRAKHRLPLPGEEIKVTHLRRAERAQGEVDEREQVEGSGGGWTLDHTITVKEHPRDQWYPSLGPAYLEDGTWNPASHRRIQIGAHTRGEGPLVEKHSLTVVVR